MARLPELAIEVRKLAAGHYMIDRADGESFQVLRMKIGGGWVIERQSDFVVYQGTVDSLKVAKLIIGSWRYI